MYHRPATQPPTKTTTRRPRTDRRRHEGRGLPVPPAGQHLDQRGARRGDELAGGALGPRDSGDAEEEAEGGRGRDGEVPVGGEPRDALCWFGGGWGC